MVILAAAAWATEASADAYAILSLIGDHVTIIGQGTQVGSHLDQNRTQVVPLVESQLDDFAAKVADATIAKMRPQSGVATLRASDPALYKMRDSWLDADLTEIRDLVSMVKGQLPLLPDAHLLLITPYRDQPELKTGSESRGSGKVAGLGFYIDTMTPFVALQGAPGFLGVFANFQLILINLQTNAIEGHERVVLGTTHPAAYAKDRTAWNALDQTQKTKALASLIKRGIEGKLPEMLGAPKQ